MYFQGRFYFYFQCTFEFCIFRVDSCLYIQGGFVDAFVTVAIVHTVVHTFWAAWHAFLSAIPFSGPTYLLIGT